MQFLEFSIILTSNLMVSCNPVSVPLVSGREGGLENKKKWFFFHIIEAVQLYKARYREVYHKEHRPQQLTTNRVKV